VRMCAARARQRRRAAAPLGRRVTTTATVRTGPGRQRDVDWCRLWERASADTYSRLRSVTFDDSRGCASAHASPRRRRRRLVPSAGLRSRASAARGQRGCRSSLVVDRRGRCSRGFPGGNAASSERRVPMVCGARRMGDPFLRRRGRKFESAEGVGRLIFNCRRVGVTDRVWTLDSGLWKASDSYRLGVDLNQVHSQWFRSDMNGKLTAHCFLSTGRSWHLEQRKAV
jgi:hypothetical protein